jgi:hypothetical protein
MAYSLDGRGTQGQSESEAARQEGSRKFRIDMVGRQRKS